jgi:dihydrofolate synthase/folylpolyglutamate synthase
VIAAPTTDQVWQALLHHAGRRHTPHYLLDDGSLAPLRQALRHLGDPQEGLPTVHIAGSKGKGSTALYLERLLLSHGCRVATFTSPHLQHWRERFRVCGEPVAERALLDAVQRVQEVMDAGAFAHEPRFFDLLTAIAVTLFATSKPDWTLLETGIGGRFDATNVVQPALCVITRIELEHRDVLGDTIAEIAAHKAGIIKSGIPVVCAALVRDAHEIVARTAQDAGAPLLCAGRDFEHHNVRTGPATQRVVYRGKNTMTFDLAAAAPALAENAALALAAYENLRPAARADAVTAAFAQALPARCEFLPGAPAIVIDAAHTPASFGALHDALREIPHRRLHFLVACSSERHMHELVAGLGDAAQHVVTTLADANYTVPAERLAQVLRSAHPHLEVAACAELSQAFGEAAHRLGEHDLLCITGSTYLAGRARTLLSERVNKSSL